MEPKRLIHLNFLIELMTSDIKMINDAIYPIQSNNTGDTDTNKFPNILIPPL